MAKLTTTIAATNATDADFRVWGKSISDALLAFGWTKAADTGQIDWTTVVKPAGINTAQGYEIWRMGDALQATFPVFVKIEYGSGGAANTPGIWLTIGTGSNGTGTITGSQLVRKQRTSNIASATVGACNYAGDTNRFTCAMWHTGGAGGTSSVLWFNIERTHDAAGADTNEGVLTCGSVTSGIIASQQFLSFAAGAAVEETSLGCLAPHSSTAGSSGTQTSVFPIFLTKGIFLNPLMNVLGYMGPTIAAGSNSPIVMYGAARAYLAIAVATISGATFRMATANQALLVRNE